MSDALLCYASFILDIVCGIMKYPYHGVCRFFPYASFLVMLGKELADYKKRIETPLSFYWDFYCLLSVTAVISYLWKLDLAWNLITPIIPLTLGAVTGTLMVFRLSVWIRNASTMFSNIFTKVGRETYVVVAFSQVTVMCINYLFYIKSIVEICHSCHCTYFTEIS